MKLILATIFLFIASIFANTVGLMAMLDGSTFNGKMTCLPQELLDAFLYLDGTYNYNSYLLPTTQDNGLTWLATLNEPKTYVNVDSDGFLVLADTGYGFNDTFSRPNLQHIVIGGKDTFYVVENTAGPEGTYKIKVSGDIPDGGVPINLGQIGVATFFRRNRLGQELDFNKFTKVK